MKILITSGATREAIDGVRYLSNFSTGKTGATLAEGFIDAGHEVVYVHGVSAQQPNLSCACQVFSDFADLNQKLKSLLARQKFEAILHLAAVSDYSLTSIESGGVAQGPRSDFKLSSDCEELTLRLVKNPKIVSSLRSYSQNKNIKIVAFKLTKSTSVHEQRQAIERLFTQARPDLVVHNDLLQIEKCSTHEFNIFSAANVKAIFCANLLALSIELEKYLNSDGAL